MMTGTPFQAGIRAQLLEQFEAVGVGQHHVEQHEVHRRTGVDALARLAPVGDPLDRKAFLLGQVAEQIGHVHVVLDDQQPLLCARICGHGFASPAQDTRTERPPVA